MIKLLAEYWVEGKLPAYRRLTDERRAVIYEHLTFKNNLLETGGEHILKGAQGLQLYQDIFSANVLLSNFERSPGDWVATLTIESETEAQAWKSRNRVVKKIQEEFKCQAFFDPGPIN